MAGTPIGVDTVTSLSRRHIFPFVVDQIYVSNAVFYRLNRANRITIQGGTQFEQPIVYKKASGTGWYTGYDILDVAPDDTVKNAVWLWKQLGKTVSIDRLSLIRADHPDAVKALLKFKMAEAQQWMEDQLGFGLWSDGVTLAKSLEGLQGAIDDGTVDNTYAGLNRTGADTYWKSQIDSATTTLALLAIRKLMGKCTVGARHPTLISSTQANYDRYWNLPVSQQRFPQQPQPMDEQLLQAGFTNVVFDGVPWVVDAHMAQIGATADQFLFMHNENYYQLVVARSTVEGDTLRGFIMTDFQSPINQDVIACKLLWAGNLVVMNPGRSGKFTALTG